MVQVVCRFQADELLDRLPSAYLVDPIALHRRMIAGSAGTRTDQSPGLARTAIAPSGWSASCNLLKRTDVRERLNEIQSLAAQSSAEEVAFDQKRVLNRLDVLSRKAEECGQISAAVRCEELIGKQRGMFVERSARFLWSGRLADLIPTLNPEQLLEMENEMLEIAAQGDPVKFAELRKQLETCPVVIDAESTPVETRST
jgi:hypothetical protein